jgi:hypothetical protein
MQIDQPLGVARSLDALLAAVEHIPAVKLQREARESVAVRVGARVVARIDLRDGGVVVHAADTVIPTLHLHARSGSPEVEATAAIRMRVNVEMLTWQLRVASP